MTAQPLPPGIYSALDYHLLTPAQRATQARQSVKWYRKAAELTPAFLPLVAVFEREAARWESEAIRKGQNNG